MQKLTNNALKVIAMVTMVLDHVGVVLFPEVTWLRVLGRLAFPIYAFMIAEGCRHTRSMPRYFGTMAALAAICQVVYFVTMRSVYMCILVTFSFSIGLIWLLKKVEVTKKKLWYAAFFAGICLVLFLCELLPKALPNTDFFVDYGFIGAMIPVCIYLAKNRQMQIITTQLSLVVLSATMDALQWWCLLAVPLLLLYNGQRGKWKLKWFFYLFYPVHLVVIQGIAMLMQS